MTFQSFGEEYSCALDIDIGMILYNSECLVLTWLSTSDSSSTALSEGTELKYGLSVL